MSHNTPPSAPRAPQAGWFAAYNRIPLFVRILVSLVLGIVAGEMMGSGAAVFKPISDVVLQLLKLLATPLIFIAVVHAIYKAKGGGKTVVKLLTLLMRNTLVAILIGLAVANVLQPGRWVHGMHSADALNKKPSSFFADLIAKIPANFVDPLQHNEIISIIILAVAFGVAMRIVRQQQMAEGKTGCRTIEDLLDTGFDIVMVMLHWIFAIVPLAVFAVVARQVGQNGIGPLVSMLGFVVAVLLALGLQACWYLANVRYGSWVSPVRFLRGASDALMMAFSTASSASTLPVTYSSMKDKIGVREESATLGVMVGGTFNHDGTALYEAMAALFVVQMLGQHLGVGEQIRVVVMSVFASVGAAGIPEAGLVTMLAVFSAVNLPIEYIPLLLPLDWFLDRCRTAINVMGDMSVTCQIDGMTAPLPSETSEPVCEEPALTEAAVAPPIAPPHIAQPYIAQPYIAQTPEDVFVSVSEASH